MELRELAALAPAREPAAAVAEQAEAASFLRRKLLPLLLDTTLKHVGREVHTGIIGGGGDN